jgi:hypothetical protein
MPINSLAPCATTRCCPVCEVLDDSGLSWRGTAASAGPRNYEGTAAMAETSGYVDAPLESVWAELCDGWGYSGWVVGTIKIRDVDPSWPGEGSKLHHAVGAWPLALRDETEVSVCEARRRLVLRARGWPVGEAVIDIALSEEASGTRVTLAERPAAGPGAWVDNPVFDAVGKRRLVEMLDRFSRLVEGHRASGQLR